MHASYLDDTLSGEQRDAMRAHARGCAACAAEDARIRRALMLVRNVAPLEVSADFATRLAARLACEPRPLPAVSAVWRQWVGRGVVAVGVGMAATLAVVALTYDLGPAPVVVHAAVVVVPPAVPAEPVAAPAMFGTVASSLPVYPAMLLAQRATAHFAETHVQTVSFQASR